MRRIGLIPRRAGAALAGLAFLAGCGGSAPTPPDPAEAAKTLEKVLTSWREGGTIAAQKEASPSVVVSDPDWSNGAKLARFEIEGSPEPQGAQQKFLVNLWLEGGKKGPRKRPVHYEVGSEPVPTVFRTAFE